MNQESDFSAVYFIFKAVIEATSPTVFSILCSKPGMIDIYAPV